MPKEKVIRGNTKRSRPALNFRHALIYVKALEPALHFYRDLLGFKEIEQIPGEYARLQSAKSDSTLALHVTKSRRLLITGGVWLYLEVGQLTQLCRNLQAAGIRFWQGPEPMP